MSINKAIISGNIGQDPEIRQTQSGTAILSFSVAVNERVKDADGNWSDRANWVRCTLFGKRAESIANYLTKGTKVAIEGKLRWSQWETDGQKRSKVEVIVDEIEFMSRRDQQGGQGGYQQQAQPAYQPQAQPAYQQPVQQQMHGMPAPVEPSIYDENIPF